MIILMVIFLFEAILETNETMDSDITTYQSDF